MPLLNSRKQAILRHSSSHQSCQKWRGLFQHLEAYVHVTTQRTECNISSDVLFHEFD